MKVLLIHDYGTLNGGAEIMTVALRDALRARGHEAMLFTSRARPLPLAIQADETCYGTVGAISRVSKAFNPHAALRLRQVMKSFQPDVVFVKMFLTQLSPLILPLLRNVPSVLSVVNYNYLCPLNTKTLPDGTPCRLTAGTQCHANGCMPWLGVARNAVQRQLTDLNTFDHVFTNSEWVARRMRAENLRVDSCINNGVRLPSYSRRASEQTVVACAGRLVPKKGVDILLNAMSIVVQKIPHAKLLVAGEGPERNALERLSKDLEIAQQVEFLGHLEPDEMDKQLAVASVQAVPSVWEEPFGLVAAEAMLRSTAVIASSMGGLTEQVVEGETGYLVPPGDANAMAHAILTILQNPALADEMGLKGREVAMARFQEYQYVDKVLDVFHKVVTK